MMLWHKQTQSYENYFMSDAKYQHVNCQRCNQIQDDLFLICMTNLWCHTGRNVNISTPLYVLWGGEECSKAWRPRFEPVSVSCQVSFLGRGVFGTLAFSLLRGLFTWLKDSAPSHQPTETKNTKLHRTGLEETRPLMIFCSLNKSLV